MKTKQVLILLLLVLIGVDYWSRQELMTHDYTYGPHQPREQKSELYWLESGFKREHFDRLLPAKNCELDQQSQLACQMALEKMKYHCGLATRFEPQIIGIEREEAKYLTTSTLLAADDFTQQVNQIIDLCPLSQRPYVLAQGVNTFLSVYRDPHTYIMPFEYFQKVVASKEQKGLKFGIAIKRDQNLKWKIARIDRPTEKSNQKFYVGDEVLEVQGYRSHEVTSRWMHEQFQNAHQLKLKVISKGQERSLSLAPKLTETLNVSSQWVSETRQIGLIRIERFARSTCQDFKNQLVDLKAQDLRGLILDLRDNPGGSVDEAACIMDLLVQKNQLLFVTFDQLSETPQSYLSKKTPLYSGPLTVLVNANSASASEIVAGGLQAIHRAKVAGQRTFGKGTYQDGEIWSELESIIVFETKGYYIFANQKTAQLSGVDPDIKIPQSVNWMREQDLYLFPVSADYVDSKKRIARIAQRFLVPNPIALSLPIITQSSEEKCLEDSQFYEDSIQIALKTFGCDSKRYGSP